MENAKPHHMKNRSATKRMDAARKASREARERELVWTGVGSRLWPSYVAPSVPQDEMFPHVLCIESPAGRLDYRLTEADLKHGFKHVTDRRKSYDGIRCSQADKLSRLLHLATEGW